jgi:hypothetical protein
MMCYAWGILGYVIEDAYNGNRRLPIMVIEDVYNGNRRCL